MDLQTYQIFINLHQNQILNNNKAQPIRQKVNQKDILMSLFSKLMSNYKD